MSGFMEEALGVPDAAGGVPAPETTGISRETPQPPTPRRRLVEDWEEEVKLALKRWGPAFKRMRADIDFAYGNQWSSGITAGDPFADAAETRYVANITQRHIQQRVAALYAKNPRFVATRKRRLHSAVWDGSPQQLEQAKMAFMQAQLTGQMPDPQTQAILADASAAIDRAKLVSRVGRTLELQLAYELGETRPSFKAMMKATVRRSATTGVGWVKLGYHRPPRMEPDGQRFADVSNRLAMLERLAADLADDRIPMDAGEAERLRLAMESLKAPQQYLRREGLSFDWPLSTDIVPDYCMTQLRGFIGCRWVAQRYALPVARVQEIYKVDVSTSYRAYNRDSLAKQMDEPERSRRRGHGDQASDKPTDDLAMVYEIWCIEDGLVYTICEGYPEFLREPAPPEYFSERFWPWFLIAFNEAENDNDPWPLSEVQLIRHAQLEINRARQGLREHRRANRPKTIVAEDALDDDDRRKLQHHPANAVIALRGLAPGQKVGDVLQPYEGPAIDPALYDVKAAYEDVLRAGGSQEANLGGTAGSTATESAIAESSRSSSLTSAIDDLDDTLSDLAQAAAQMLLAEMPRVEVLRSVGPGAVWPELSVDDIAAELFVQVEAGSTGRPNRAQRIQEFERVAPLLLQVPGVKPDKLAEYALGLMADNIEVQDFLDPMSPSIAALNAAGPGPSPAAGTAPGDAPAGEAPADQGGEGAMNAPKATQQRRLGPAPNQQPVEPQGVAQNLVNRALN